MGSIPSPGTIFPRNQHHRLLRLADNWRPLFAIAEIAGGDCVSARLLIRRSEIAALLGGPTRRVGYHERELGLAGCKVVLNRRLILYRRQEAEQALRTRRLIQ